MYWPSHSNQSANIDSILEKGISGLEELLDLDNIILRTRNGDDRVLNYLTDPPILSRLIQYSMGHGLQGEKGMRYPLIACELICSEQPSLWEGLKGEVLDPVWCFPESERPVAPFIVCWARIVNHLMGKIPVEIGESLKRHPKVLENILKYLGSLEVCEVLFKLLSLRDLDEREPLILDWLVNDQVIFRRIFDALNPSVDSNLQISTLNSLTGFLSLPFPEDFPVSIMIESMITELGPALERSTAIELDRTLFSCVVDIFCLLVVRIVQHKDDKGWSPMIEKLVEIVEPHLAKFNSIFGAKSLVLYQSPSGPINPVGLFRLKTAKLFSHVMLLQDRRIVQSINSLGTCSSLLVYHSFERISILGTILLAPT